jgi:hypothetical protein
MRPSLREIAGAWAVCGLIAAAAAAAGGYRPATPPSAAGLHIPGYGAVLSREELSIADQFADANDKDVNIAPTITVAADEPAAAPNRRLAESHGCRWERLVRRLL